MKKLLTIKNLILTVSIVGNLILGFILLIQSFNEPTHRLGILTQDLTVGYFGQEGEIFKLPKGITVEDVAPRGIAAIGQFENNRFSIVLTSEIDSLIDYNVNTTDLAPNGNFYSADYPHFEIRK